MVPEYGPLKGDPLYTHKFRAHASEPIREVLGTTLRAHETALGQTLVGGRSGCKVWRVQVLGLKGLSLGFGLGLSGVYGLQGFAGLQASTA